jgi:hypothetical protein
MPRRIVLALSALLASATFGASSPDIPLDHLRSGHPRLLVTNEALATALAAAKSDPLRAALHQRIVATAAAIIPMPPLRHNDGAALPEQERVAVYQILTCAMAYRLTGEPRFAERAKFDLLTVAGFSDWDPQHDLAIGEMSFAVAIGYDWLFGWLDPDTRAAIKQALLEKSLRGAALTTNAGNHNQVYNAGLVSAALALADEEPALARKVLMDARASMPYALSAYAPDGAFPEGPGYWTYGTTYSVITFAALETALGTDLGLSAAPGFARTIEYYETMQGPAGAMFNYADSTDDLQNSPARAWLAERYHIATATRGTRALLAETLQRETIVSFDRAIQSQVVNRFFALHAAWFPRAPAATDAAAELPLDAHFRGIADVAVFRSAWNDPEAIFVGFKAGENGDHHAHLDSGSFVLDANGQRWAMDLGPDSPNAHYDLPGYFDNKRQRWTYFRTNNHSHNTVTPGEALQSRHIAAPIVAFKSAPEFAFAVADLTPVYPTETSSLRRGIALLDRARVLVQDEYRPVQPGTPLHWRMITAAKIELGADGRSATLTKQSRSLRVDLIEPAFARLHVLSTRPPTAAETQNDGTVMLAIELTPPGNADVTRLAVLLTPIGDQWPRLRPPAIKPLADWR